MPYGYTGKILRVNLSEKTISMEEPEEFFYRKYWGGRGLISYYLLKELPKGADPFGPENVLVFAAGPLTGAPFAGSGRNSVGARSPLTGGYGDSEAGGYFGAELKRAGFDAVVVKGASDKPVYLWIHDGKAEIRDASHLWGRTTSEVDAEVKRELGDKLVRVSQCGPAGENLVRFSCVVNDVTHFAGRTGMGAVMGSKKLRAVAVRGTGAVSLSDPGKVRELSKRMAENVPRLAFGLQDTGTAGGTVNLSAAGGLPTRNFQEGSFEGAQKISGQTMRDTILVDRETCFACPIRCKRVVKTDDPVKVDPVYGGPEYETVAALGSSLGVDSLAHVSKGNEMCAALGLDTISTGVTIAFAMECFAQGLLAPEDVEGLDLRFGNGDAALKLIEMIARRRGIGDLLAEGTKRASERIGGKARELAMHVRGQEIPMHEPRLKYGLGIGYALSPTGADHCHNMHDTLYEKRENRAMEELYGLGILDPLAFDDLSAEKIHMFWTVTNLRTFCNVAVLCQFVPWTVIQLEELCRAVTGWNVTAAEMLLAGERANTLARIFNLREGLRNEDEVLPRRFFRPFTSGPLKDRAARPEDWAKAKLVAYRMAGWDERGVPSAECLGRLGISWAGEMIPRCPGE